MSEPETYYAVESLSADPAEPAAPEEAGGALDLTSEGTAGSSDPVLEETSGPSDSISAEGKSAFCNTEVQGASSDGDDSATASSKSVAPPATNEHVRKSMQGNKRKDTKPELLMRARLRAAGLTGYRLQWKVPGRPDIAWPGKRVAIQVMGCFWHRCPHCHPSTPKSHVEYWVAKFERNVERDERTLAELEEAGWTVHVVWECQLKKKTIDDTLHELFPRLSRELGKPLTEGWDA